MTFDFYALLAELGACPTDGKPPECLVSGLLEGCTTWFAVNKIRADEYDARMKAKQNEGKKKALSRENGKHEKAKNDARRCYMERAKGAGLQLPSALDLDPWPPALLHNSWLAIAVEFELLTPWYSKDDRLFHVLDNPVRKDRVFGVPYMAAASWKGMLRWACRMQDGLRDHLESGKRFEEWNDPEWVLHLFGNEKGEEEDFHQGALGFYPTWFDKIGFEVINPHDRSRRAGTQPIYYEVVPGRRPKAGGSNADQEGGKGFLCLLYAPWPGMKAETKPEEVLHHLLEAIETMLTVYGVSAKRTVGWGTAEIKKWRAWKKETPDNNPIEADNREGLLQQIFPKSGGGS
ncbi:RAMP superfamily CRISPR-associated protein [Limisphaera ngatamarikiensis]|nr:RAMP superfamily CRISPR-associated protein [Limisphaera ngatamarikiensis]